MPGAEQPAQETTNNSSDRSGAAAHGAADRAAEPTNRPADGRRRATDGAAQATHRTTAAPRRCRPGRPPYHRARRRCHQRPPTVPPRPPTVPPRPPTVPAEPTDRPAQAAHRATRGRRPSRRRCRRAHRPCRRDRRPFRHGATERTDRAAEAADRPAEAGYGAIDDIAEIPTVPPRLLTSPLTVPPTSFTALPRDPTVFPRVSPRTSRPRLSIRRSSVSAVVPVTLVTAPVTPFTVPRTFFSAPCTGAVGTGASAPSRQRHRPALLADHQPARELTGSVRGPDLARLQVRGQRGHRIPRDRLHRAQRVAGHHHALELGEADRRLGGIETGAHVERAVEEVHAGRRRGRAPRLAGLHRVHLDHEDGAAHRGRRVRRADLDDLARRMRAFTTATPTLPDCRSTVTRPASSVTVRTDSSRTVMRALPPREHAGPGSAPRGPRTLVGSAELSVLTVTEEAGRVTVDLQSGKVGVAVVKAPRAPGEIIRDPLAERNSRGARHRLRGRGGPDAAPGQAGSAPTTTTRVHLFHGALDVSARLDPAQPAVRLAGAPERGGGRQLAGLGEADLEGCGGRADRGPEAAPGRDPDAPGEFRAGW